MILYDFPILLISVSLYLCVLANKNGLLFFSCFLSLIKNNMKESTKPINAAIAAVITFYKSIKISNNSSSLKKQQFELPYVPSL